MAFKLTNPPYRVNQTPVYHVDMEEGVIEINGVKYAPVVAETEDDEEEIGRNGLWFGQRYDCRDV